MSGSSLQRKLLRNFAANAYGQLVTVVIQLISVPLLFYYWGVELYGEWLILSAIPAYLSLSDIGFASVAANDMAMRVAQGDQKGTLEVYQSIWIAICTVSLLAGCAVGYLVLSYPVDRLFSISHIGADQTSQVLFILMLHVLVGLQGGVLNAGFRAAGRYAYGTACNNTVRLAEWMLSMVALTLGGGVLVVAVAALIVRVSGTVVLWIALRMQTPWLNLGFHAASLQTIRKLFKPAIAFMAFPLGSALSLQGTVLAIGMLLGPAAVAVFSAYRTLTRIVVQGIAMLNQAVWPEISAAYGAGQMDVVTNLHRRASSATFWIALAGIVTLGLTGEWIIGVWTHHAFESNHVLLVLLLATAFLNVLWQTSGVILMATNMHQRTSLAFIGTAAGGLVTSSLLLQRMGVNGAGVALVIAELPMLYLTINSGLVLLDDRWPDYAKAVVGNPFVRKGP